MARSSIQYTRRRSIERRPSEIGHVCLGPCPVPGPTTRLGSCTSLLVPTFETSRPLAVGVQPRSQPRQSGTSDTRRRTLSCWSEGVLRRIIADAKLKRSDESTSKPIATYRWQSRRGRATPTLASSVEMLLLAQPSRLRHASNTTFIQTQAIDPPENSWRFRLRLG